LVACVLDSLTHAQTMTHHWQTTKQAQTQTQTKTQTQTHTQTQTRHRQRHRRRHRHRERHRHRHRHRLRHRHQQQTPIAYTYLFHGSSTRLQSYIIILYNCVLKTVSLSLPRSVRETPTRCYAPHRSRKT